MFSPPEVRLKPDATGLAKSRTPLVSTHQLTNSPIHQFTNSPTHQFANSLSLL
jgi:hypothetical protein